jgi:predicted porin
MNKKLMAIAVAGALAAPAAALAQSSTVQIYGTLVMNYNFVDLGRNKVQTDMFNTHDTNLGFKGEEMLGGGLSAWFQCESTMDVTGAGAAGGAAAWCGRNSAFGMKGNFGNIFAGIWDTPMKTAMANFRPFSTSGAYGMSNIMWNTSGSDVGNGPAGVGANVVSFTRRQTNLWTYQTPNWAGFQGGIAYSAANEATAQVNASVGKKPRLWSLGLTYTNGPLIVGGGYERHTNYNPAGLPQANFPQPVGVVSYTGGDDRAWDLGIAYTFMGTLKLSAIYNDVRYDTGPGTTAGGKTWGLWGDWAIAGPHRVRAGYTRKKDTSGNFGGAVNAAGVCAVVAIGQWSANCGQGSTGATLYALQYAYAFSKRTELNFGYARVNNDANSGIALATLGGRNVGQNQSAWVFGTKHSF